MKKAVFLTLSLLLIMGAHEPTKESIHIPLKAEKFIRQIEKTVDDPVDKQVDKPIKEKTVEEKPLEDEIVERAITDEEWKMITLCVEAEAGNQDIKGKRLVADVILNRVDSERFPDNIVDVITQKYQFSTYWDGAMDRAKPSDETNEAVMMELESRTDDEILFFTAGGYNKYCVPAYKYGDHYFGY